MSASGKPQRECTEQKGRGRRQQAAQHPEGGSRGGSFGEYLGERPHGLFVVGSAGRHVVPESADRQRHRATLTAVNDCDAVGFGGRIGLKRVHGTDCVGNSRR